MGAGARGECPQRRGNCLVVTARPPLRVLGIDPGTASTGFGVVDARAQTLSTVTGGVISTGVGRSARAPAGRDRRTPVRAARRARRPTRSRSRRSSSAATSAAPSRSVRPAARCWPPPGARRRPVLLLHAAGGEARGLRQRRARRRTRCSGWSARCWGWRRRRPPTTPPTRSRSRSATRTQHAGREASGRGRRIRTHDRLPQRQGDGSRVPITS